MPLRLIFMGTPEFSVPTLRALAEAGHEVAAVYTQPPRPAGRRGLEATPSPVQREAERLGIEVRTPVSLKGEAEQQAFRDLRADAAVVVAYGLLLPVAILEGTRLGAFNGHASLLPRWRGAAPIQRAIMAGDRETGMMIMKMDAGLDTGPVALAERVAIDSAMTGGELHDRLKAVGARLMVEALAQLEAGDAAPGAAGGRRRDLCAKNRQGGDAHRLAQAGTSRCTITSARCRPSRRLVRSADCRQARAAEGAALGRRRRRRRTGNVAR